MKKYFLMDYQTERHSSAAHEAVRKSIPLRISENHTKKMFNKAYKLFANISANVMTFANNDVTMVSIQRERG